MDPDLIEYDVMDWDYIKEIVPKEAAVIEHQLAAAGAGMDEFCRAMKHEDYLDVEIGDADMDEWHDRLMEAWHKLDEAFTAATTVNGAGLHLTPDYHDPDYEKPFAFFAVEGVREMTPAGAKYQYVIQRRIFTGIG